MKKRVRPSKSASSPPNPRPQKRTSRTPTAHNCHAENNGNIERSKCLRLVKIVDDAAGVAVSQRKLLNECVCAAELLSNAGTQELCHAVANMASGVQSLDAQDAAALGVSSIRLFAERLFVRGNLERSLSVQVRRKLADAPLVPHFLTALELSWQTAVAADNEPDSIDSQMTTTSSASISSSSSSYKSSRSSRALPLPSFKEPAWQVSLSAKWILEHLITYVREVHGPQDKLATPSSHPSRSLIGTITDPRSSKTFDVVICRDKSSVLEGVTILFTEEMPQNEEQRNEKTKKRQRQIKIGYLLAKIDDHGNLALRGVHIAEHARGKGLSKLLLSAWLLLCRKLRIKPCTCVMDKPLISLALQSLGFVPDRKTFPVEVQLPPKNNRTLSHGEEGDSSGSLSASAQAEHKNLAPGKSVIWSQDINRLRSIFSKSICRSQRIVIADARPAHARTAYVRTAFSLPTSVGLRKAGPKIAKFQMLEHVFYSSRLLAFISRLPRVCDRLILYNVS